MACRRKALRALRFLRALCVVLFFCKNLSREGRKDFSQRTQSVGEILDIME